MRKVICPLCKTEATWEGNPFRPFCSDVCQLKDLGKWATEEYRVAAEEAEPGLGKAKIDDDEDE